MILHIKNMVCDRCILVVKQQLKHFGYLTGSVNLGVAEILSEPDHLQLIEIGSALKIMGFELLDNEKDQIIERIKNLIIKNVHHSDLTDNKINFSHLLSRNIEKDYAFLSRMFSASQNITIEKFIIQQKVEKVKELLEYGKLNLNEIGYKMGYSSSAHLSAQFKSITGMTPSQYKSSGIEHRKPIDFI